MFLIVVGAGRTGTRVIELATQANHEVVVLEKDRQVAEATGQGFDCLVIHDDGASRDALIEADIEDADALIATTDEDATNLLVMMHGRDFGVETLVSSVNTAANVRLYRQLGVHVVESPHRLNGEYLYRAVQRPAIRDFMEIGEGAEIFEIVVEDRAPVAGKTLDEAAQEGLLGDEMIIVAIQRDGSVLVPKGQTSLQPDDLVTVFALVGATTKTTAPFQKPGGR